MAKVRDWWQEGTDLSLIKVGIGLADNCVPRAVQSGDFQGIHEVSEISQLDQYLNEVEELKPIDAKSEVDKIFSSKNDGRSDRSETLSPKDEI
jgi:hypothetical protein